MTVGERLREARERQQVSLHAIAAKTNISVRFLEAIEKNQFDKLPGGIFTRGFIRSYASQVGLDPDAAVAHFLTDVPSARFDDEDGGDQEVRSGTGVRTWIATGLGLAALALLLLYLFAPDWMRQASLPADLRATADTPEQASLPAPAAAPPAETAPAAPSAAAAATASGALQLVMTPRSRCWVQVLADGEIRVARELAAGERVAIAAAERLQIIVGDAGAFAYDINGRPGRALGEAGRVARATIVPATVGQFQRATP